MKISVFGLGYVGCVSVGCLAELGHSIIGVDVSRIKVDLINAGKPTIVEKDIDLLISMNVNRGLLYASDNALEAVLATDISIICVGTPSQDDGSLNLSHIYKCAEQIGLALINKQEFHTVVIRSTVIPGTNRRVGDIISEASGKIINDDFGVVSNPEFLREGSAVKDYFNPPITVLGSYSLKSIKIMKDVYQSIPAEIVVTEVNVAEIIKYVNNSFHALKVTFANEVGNVCKKLNIDSHHVMDVFCKDKHLNISEYYFKPGFAYGGSCLPKDLGAMVALSEKHGLVANVLSSIQQSNEYQKSIAYDMIVNTKRNRIGLIGISFKTGTDDLRYSPMIDIYKRLILDGYNVGVFDENVRISILMGANREYIDKFIPELSISLKDSMEKVIDESDVIVVSQKSNELSILLEKFQDIIIIDYARLDLRASHANYFGICW